MPLSIAQAISWGKKRLEHLETHRQLEVEELLQWVLQEDKLFLYTQRQQLLTISQTQQFIDLIEKRCNRYPLAYLTGYKGFMSLSFEVTPAVLIPRPETELLVEYVIDTFAGRSIEGLDIGIGSGCIAVSILHYLPHAHFTGVDILPQALNVAQTNARQLGVEKRLVLIEGDLLQPFLTKQFDVITANPPYIREDEYDDLMPEVKYEPTVALIAGDGLEYYRRILTDVCRVLKVDGMLLLELGYGQCQAVCAEVPKNLQQVKVIKDYNGIERILVLKRIF